MLLLLSRLSLICCCYCCDCHCYWPNPTYNNNQNNPMTITHWFNKLTIKNQPQTILFRPLKHVGVNLTEPSMGLFSFPSYLQGDTLGSFFLLVTDLDNVFLRSCNRTCICGDACLDLSALFFSGSDCALARQGSRHKLFFFSYCNQFLYNSRVRKTAKLHWNTSSFAKSACKHA